VGEFAQLDGPEAQCRQLCASGRFPSAQLGEPWRRRRSAWAIRATPGFPGSSDVGQASEQDCIVGCIESADIAANKAKFCRGHVPSPQFACVIVYRRSERFASSSLALKEAPHFGETMLLYQSGGINRTEHERKDLAYFARVLFVFGFEKEDVFVRND
jgi:hypothetical protein